MLRKKLKRLLLAIALSLICLIPFSFKPITAATPDVQIVLDLAHLDSSLDNGAAYAGYTERELVNEITIKVKDILEKNNIKVKLTRDYDTPITLQERVELANREKMDYYISLHINSTEKPNTGTGVEAFSNDAWSLSNSICKELSQRFNFPNRGVYPTPYYNIHINKPSTLIELGFINTDYDREILVNHKDEIAEIVANNIIKQYENIKIETIKTIKIPEEIKMADGKTITVIKTIEIGE